MLFSVCVWSEPTVGKVLNDAHASLPSYPSANETLLSIVPSQLSSRLLQVSVVWLPKLGVHVLGIPLMHWGTVTWQTPLPHVVFPGFTFVHVPAVVPVHVASAGSWQSALQVSTV